MTEPGEGGAPRLVDGAYTLHEKLGEGGMGAVFSATQRIGGRTVALKVIRNQALGGHAGDSQTQLLLALAREFQTLSSLHHPNVIQVLEYGFDGELGPYFTMELLASPLSMLDAAVGRGLGAKVELCAQLLRALAYLHRRGIIHRDLKPSNVLCVRGQVKVVDFGIATTDPGKVPVAGTLDYMAPELFHGHPPSVRSDLYAFGVMAEELLLSERLRSEDSRRSLEQALTVDHVAALGPRPDSTTIEVPSLTSPSPSAGPGRQGTPTAEIHTRTHEIALRPEETPTVEIARVPGGQRTGGMGGIGGVAGGFPRHAKPRTSAREAMGLSADHPLAPVVDGLSAIVDRLRAVRPEDRYGSAAEVLAALGQAIGVTLPVETQATRESFLQASELVGREAELSELRQALAGALHGTGGAWLVGGESGVGKSRLVSELRTLALVQGACVVQGQAVSEGSRSYEVWLPTLRSLCLRADPPDADAAVLKELLPDLVDLLGRPLPDAPRLAPAAAQTRLVEVIEACFRRQSKPTVVILEDLQWAQEDSLTLFGRIARLAGGMALLLVGNYRDEEAPELAAGVPDARSMKLSRLQRHQVARLCVSMLGHAGEQPELVDYLCHETEGNVFFLVEVVRALAEQAGQLDHIGRVPLPEQLVTGGIERIVRRRIERVPPADRALLDVAATLGRKLDLAVLEVLAPAVDRDRWLVSCANAAVLESQGGDWRVAHDKFREGILAAIPRDRRRVLHGRIGLALETVYEGPARDARSAVLAHHFEHAGDADKASVYHARAGEIATRLCSYGEARRHHLKALEALADLPATDDNRRRRVDALLNLVYTTMVSDATEQNLARMSEATTLLEAIAGAGPGSGSGSSFGHAEGLAREDMVRMARVNNVIGRIHLYGGKSREAIAYFRRVLPVAQASGDDELLALPSCLIGTALLTQGDMRGAEPLLAQAAGPLERLGEPFEWFRAVGYHGFSLIVLGRYREGLAELDRVHARAHEIGQPSLLSAAHLMRGTALTLASDWVRVIDDSKEVLRLAAQTGDKLHLSLAWSNLGWAQSCLGHHPEAVDCRARAKELAQAMGGRLILSDWYDAADTEIALAAGHVDEARTQASALAETSRAAGLFVSYGIAERVWGAALAAAGEASAADAHMATSVEVMEGAGLVLPAARTRLWWALQRRDRGERATAKQLFEQAIAQLAASGCAYSLADAERRWCEA